jgi:hypothetical protein
MVVVRFSRLGRLANPLALNLVFGPLVFRAN